ncbi:MAG: hypothetical protein WBZ36_00420 [Candidatus Nitrosopolaris sp.]|jgi:hypothetical protein
MAMNIAICYGIAFSENTRRIVYHVKVNKIKNKMGSDYKTPTTHIKDS